MSKDKKSALVDFIDKKFALKKILILLFIGMGLLFFFVFIFTLSGSGPFLGSEWDVWKLVILFSFPILSVIFIIYFSNRKRDDWAIERIFFRITFGSIVLYLLLIYSPLFLWPFFLPLREGLSPIKILKTSSYGILPFQLVVIGIIIILFSKKILYVGPKMKVLFLSANPFDTSRIRIDEEIREIDEELSRGKKRDHFILKQKFAVRIDTIQQALLDEKPYILHFSGHGVQYSNDHHITNNKNVRPKNEKVESGLIIEDKSGRAKMVEQKAMSELFKLFSESIECVILNACYSKSQAQVISNYIPFVIGTTQAIPDKAAIAFSIGFYKALAAGKSIEFAYKLAKNSIQLEGFNKNYSILFKNRRE